MNRNDGHGGRGFIVGLVLGALAGAVAGLFWSPRSGAENRERFTQAVSDGLGPSGNETATRVADELKARLEGAREAFHEGANETRARMQAELDESRRGET